MKQLFLVLITLVITITGYGQRQKKIDKIIANGRTFKKPYVYKQSTLSPASFISSLTIPKVQEFHKRRPYRVLSYETKSIKTKHGTSTYVIEFEFMPVNDLSYFFEKYTNNKYVEKKGEAFIPYFDEESKLVFKPLQSVCWTGGLQNGKLHGSGVGMINFNNHPLLFEGTFDQGFALGDLSIRFIHITTEYFTRYYGFKIDYLKDEYSLNIENNGSFQLTVASNHIKRKNPIPKKVDGIIERSGNITLDTNRDSTEDYHKKAMELIQNKELEKLKALADQIRKYGFPEADYLEGMYNAYRKGGVFSTSLMSARSDFKKALENGINLAALQLAKLELDSKKYEKAETYFDQYYGEKKPVDYYLTYGKHWTKQDTKPENYAKASDYYYKAYELSKHSGDLFMAAACITESDIPNRKEKVLEWTNTLVKIGYKDSKNIDRLYVYVDPSSQNSQYRKWDALRRKNIGSISAGDQLCFRGGYEPVYGKGLYFMDEKAVVEGVNVKNRKVRIKIKGDMTVEGAFRHSLLKAMGADVMGENRSVNGYGYTVYSSSTFSPYVWISLEDPRWFSCD